MKITHNECKKILENLKLGYVYGGFINKINDGVIYINGSYIRYERSGASAIKINERELYWLLNTIFKTCDYIAPCRYSFEKYIFVEY